MVEPPNTCLCMKSAHLLIQTLGMLYFLTTRRGESGESELLIIYNLSVSGGRRQKELSQDVLGQLTSMACIASCLIWKQESDPCGSL